MAERYIKIGDFIDQLGKHADVYETLENTPEADIVEVKQIKIIRNDLKWWLETNNEKGVVHIPKYVIENMIAKMDGTQQKEG